MKIINQSFLPSLVNILFYIIFSNICLYLKKKRELNSSLKIYLQVSLIKHHIKERIDNKVQTKKNVVNATANIVAIPTTAKLRITAIAPANIPPNPAISKQVAILHIHFLNELQLFSKLAAKSDANKIANPIADTIKATPIYPESAVNVPFENNTPVTTPAIILNITSIIHVPLQLDEQL